MNIIFLDFNGVLDSFDNMDVIDDENLEILKRIVFETNSFIVISSSIKNYYYDFGKHSSMFLDIVNRLEEAGIDVVGITPLDVSRGREINKYLVEHPEVKNYGIIDDEIFDFYNSDLGFHLLKLKSQRDGGNGLKDCDYIDEFIDRFNLENNNICL